MGLFSFIGDCISSAVSAVGSAISAVGRAVVDTAKVLIREAAGYIETIAKAVKEVCLDLDIIEPEDEVEELGAKAMACDKKLEDFDSASEYIEYIKENITLDKAKMDERSDAEKLGHKALGISILAKGMEEKTGVTIPAEFLPEVGRHDIKSDKVLDIISSYKENNNLSDFPDYLRGNLDLKDRINAGKKMEKVVSKMVPEMSETEIDKKIMEMCEKTREDKTGE